MKFPQTVELQPLKFALWITDSQHSKLPKEFQPQGFGVEAPVIDQFMYTSKWKIEKSGIFHVRV